MLATLNRKQIVDEIVKDTVKDNDPHDAVQISPEIVLASRPISVAPALAPDIATRPEPKFALEPEAYVRAQNLFEPKFSPVSNRWRHPRPPSTRPCRVAASDGAGPRKRSAAGKWLRGAFVTFLFAEQARPPPSPGRNTATPPSRCSPNGHRHLASLLPSTSQTAPVAAAQAAPPAEQAATDQSADQSATAARSPGRRRCACRRSPMLAQSVQAMTRDLAAMAQQIEQLKANIAELKAGQEQMAREMAKPPAPKPVAEAKPVDPRAVSRCSPPRPARRRRFASRSR